MKASDFETINTILTPPELIDPSTDHTDPNRKHGRPIATFIQKYSLDLNLSKLLLR